MHPERLSWIKKLEKSDPIEHHPGRAHGIRPNASRGQAHVLLVEDDLEISRLLLETLEENGFATSSVGSGTEMDMVLLQQSVDLIVLDLMLPGEDGLSICRRLRAESSLPVIMLTARGDCLDRVVGLELGADDYVPKPFDARELVARIRAILRRAPNDQGCPERPKPLRFAGWLIDPAARELRNPEGVKVSLTGAEFDLLLAFCRNPGRVLSREQLLSLTHSGTAGPIDRTVDVHVRRIRQRIESNPSDPAMIKTVRLGGYVFTPAVEPV
jgi:two-component system OmpR family response regulator